jgi:putative oxidoreductase
MFTKIHSLLAAVGGFLQPIVLLIIRLFWGWQFMQTGWGKLHNLERTTAFFTSLGIPAPKLNAILASCTECSCGTLLALGLFTRFASPALMTVMCVAYVTAEPAALRMIFSDPDKFLGADPFLFLYAATIVFAFGPGKLSLDTLVWRDRKA